MTKPEQNKEDKILKGVERIAQQMNEQYSVIIKKLEQHDGHFENINNRFNRLESAVMENTVQLKELKVEMKGLKQTVEIAVTNHESRIQKLEAKVGI